MTVEDMRSYAVPADWAGSSATFIAGAVVAGAAMFMLPVISPIWARAG